LLVASGNIWDRIDTKCYQASLVHFDPQISLEGIREDRTEVLQQGGGKPPAIMEESAQKITLSGSTIKQQAEGRERRGLVEVAARI
jgi:hypothetical protein